MSRRQSIIERARQAEEEATAKSGGNDHKFKSSRPRPDQVVAAADDAEDAANGTDDAEPEGPSSRPNRRREVSEEDTEEEDRFPWHFQFDDDEPEELQASSPLLSRAFRATIG
jgi:hypothetical protein